MRRNATVNACDIHTVDLPSQVAQADILVVAAGSAHLVKVRCTGVHAVTMLSIMLVVDVISGRMGEAWGGCGGRRD